MLSGARPSPGCCHAAGAVRRQAGALCAARCNTLPPTPPPLPPSPQEMEVAGGHDGVTLEWDPNDMDSDPSARFPWGT